MPGIEQRVQGQCCTLGLFDTSLKDLNIHSFLPMSILMTEHDANKKWRMMSVKLIAYDRHAARRDPIPKNDFVHGDHRTADGAEVEEEGPAVVDGH